MNQKRPYNIHIYKYQLEREKLWVKVILERLEYRTSVDPTPYDRLSFSSSRFPMSEPYQTRPLSPTESLDAPAPLSS